MTFHTAARVEQPRWYQREIWKPVAAWAALILVTTLAYGAWRNYELRQVELEQKDALILNLSDSREQIQELENRLARSQQRANKERREGSRERSRLLRQQSEMLELLRNLEIIPAGTTPPFIVIGRDPDKAGSKPNKPKPQAQPPVSGPPAPSPGPVKPGNPAPGVPCILGLCLPRATAQ